MNILRAIIGGRKQSRSAMDARKQKAKSKEKVEEEILLHSVDFSDVLIQFNYMVWGDDMQCHSPDIEHIFCQGFGFILFLIT